VVLFCFSKQLLSMFPLPYLTALQRVVTDSQILQQCFVVSRTALITTIVADADTNSWGAVGTNRHKCRCTNNQIIFFLLAATRSRRLQPADSAVVGAWVLRHYAGGTSLQWYIELSLAAAGRSSTDSTDRPVRRLQSSSAKLLSADSTSCRSLHQSPSSRCAPTAKP